MTREQLAEGHKLTYDIEQWNKVKAGIMGLGVSLPVQGDLQVIVKDKIDCLEGKLADL